jgi:hypothetical protein
MATEKERRQYALGRSEQPTVPHKWRFSAISDGQLVRVLAWLDDRVELRPIVDDGPRVRTSCAHEQFQAWALAEGFKRDTLPAVNGFVQRIKANAPSIEHRRNREGRFFVGMVLRHFTPPSPYG